MVWMESLSGKMQVVKLFVILCRIYQVSNPDVDKKRDTLAKSNDLQPDEIKVYPCQNNTTKIETWHKLGK